mmetsp:Transcript_31025/g.56385  ORF Transcript_31025/g.56385 Transcript_31025/m.56385 type:complete len:756 (+) Transcript_31025:95-2362(+)
MEGESGAFVMPPPPLPHQWGEASRDVPHRRRHRRGRGRAQAKFNAAADGNMPAKLNGKGGFNGKDAEAMGNMLPQGLSAIVASSGFGKRSSGPQDSEQQQAQNEKMIREFKTIPCGLEGSMSSHDHRCCPFYHSERDRRRLVIVDGAPASYSAEPCSDQFDDPRVCPRGDACGFCHSTAELLYHPDFFRKRLCHQAKRCPRGRFCAFAHSRQELLVPHFSEVEETEPTEDFITWRFKTQWCPIGGPHDWENCVYAHTYRDWRRVPSLGYSSRPCPHWVQSVTTGPPELSYEHRCPRGMGCPLAHGAKEQLYHPQFYKTSPCSEANCKRGALCAFTHGAYDLRRPRTDEAGNAVREPILEAVELLGQNQPTFWSPPKYHALEDPPKSTAGPSKNRSRKSSAASIAFSPGNSKWGDAGKLVTESMDALGPPGELLPAALPAIAAESLPTNVEPLSSSPHEPLSSQLMGHPAYTQPPQYMCQWVPCEAPPTQLLPAPVGYGSQPVADPWTMQQMQMGYSNWVWNQPGMHPAGMQPCLMSLPPPSPSKVEPQATGPLLDDLASEDDGVLEASPKAKVGPATSTSPMHLDDNALSAALATLGGATSPAHVMKDDSRHMSNMLQINSIPHWPAAPLPVGPMHLPLRKTAGEDEEFIARQHNHYLRKGLRTPSSLGSPPLSAAPTEAPSPRIVEAASGDGSVYGSSDDVPQAVRDPQILEASMRELPAPQVVMDALVEPQPLALMEAPHPVSPLRSRSVPPL